MQISLVAFLGKSNGGPAAIFHPKNPSKRKPTNILANRCTYFHVNPKIYEMLEQEGMESLPEGHCYGVSLFFIKFFLEHPDKLYLPLKDLLQEFLEDSRFEQLSREFQKL